MRKGFSLFELIFTIVVILSIFIAFFDIDTDKVKANVKQVTEQTLVVQEQTDKVAKNAVEINEKANKILDENEKYRLLVIDLRERLAEAHSKLTICKETVQEDDTGTGY